jgi:hypothetical protein
MKERGRSRRVINERKKWMKREDTKENYSPLNYFDFFYE